MIVHRDRQRLLRLFLSDHVLVQKGLDLLRRTQINLTLRKLHILFRQLVLHNLGTDVNTFVTDIYSTRSGNQLTHLILCLVAEGTPDFFKILSRHISPYAL